MTIEWRDVVGYEGLYQISNMGDIKSMNYKMSKGLEVVMSTRKDRGGYEYVILCKNSKRETKKIHRLVAIAFISNPENKPCVDHINTIRDDNRVENLRWVTHIENNNNTKTLRNKSESRSGELHHMYGKHHSESAKEKISVATVGGNNPRAKKVICEGIIYDCIKDCAEHYGVNYGTMKAWFNKEGRKIPEKFIELGLSLLEEVEYDCSRQVK